MIDSRWSSLFECHDLSRVDDPRDFAYRVVAALAAGEPVVLDLGTVHGILLSALHPATLDRLINALPASDSPESLTLLLKDSEELADWVSNLGSVAKRLSRRLWPGSTILMLPSSKDESLFRFLDENLVNSLSPGDFTGFRVLRDAFLRDVLRLVAGPVVLRSFSSDEVNDEFLAKLKQAGVKLVGEASDQHEESLGSVVKVEGEKWELVRAGEIDERAIRRSSGTIVLFVCTGNTCRSPMAEAICKVLIAERLKCPVAEIESKGFAVLSAGVAAIGGMPAASHAIDVVQARGGSLSEHASRKLTLDLVRSADHILAMTRDHLDAMLSYAPEASKKATLLHPEGKDVADPVGADRETYQRCAKAIESYLKSWLDSIRL